MTPGAPAPGRWHRSRLAALPFRSSFAGRVGFPEVDAAGIAFFASIQGWFHEAMVRFLHEAGQPLWTQLRSGTGMAPLVHAEADYLAPLRFGDAYVAGLVDAELSERRFTLAYRVDGPDGPAATGATVHVWVDPATFRPAALPDPLRAAFATLATS